MPSAEEENQDRLIGILIRIVIDDPKQEQRGTVNKCPNKHKQINYS